jgi:putative addiction module component (TIGR02574 family)
MNVIEIPQIAAMSIPEKINFVEELWDSIAQQSEVIPVPDSHIEELNRRLARHGAQDALLTLAELQQKVAKRM